MFVGVLLDIVHSRPEVLPVSLANANQIAYSLSLAPTWTTGWAKASIINCLQDRGNQISGYGLCSEFLLRIVIVSVIKRDWLI